MGVTKELLQEGNGTDYPSKDQTIFMQYTGWLKDPNATDNELKGKQFDSSDGRGDFKTKIGVGRVIKGWDEGIIGAGDTKGMSLGEKARLTITSDYAYGDRGFPGLIPPGSTLIFDVELVGIENKHI